VIAGYHPDVQDSIEYECLSTAERQSKLEEKYQSYLSHWSRQRIGSQPTKTMSLEIITADLQMAPGVPGRQTPTNGWASRGYLNALSARRSPSRSTSHVVTTRPPIHSSMLWANQRICFMYLDDGRIVDILVSGPYTESRPKVPH
jgi:hypothetical protein